MFAGLPLLRCRFDSCSQVGLLISPIVQATLFLPSPDFLILASDAIIPHLATLLVVLRLKSPLQTFISLLL